MKYFFVCAEFKLNKSDASTVKYSLCIPIVYGFILCLSKETKNNNKIKHYTKLVQLFCGYLLGRLNFIIIGTLT